jgi:hypothetical protein
VQLVIVTDPAVIRLVSFEALDGAVAFSAEAGRFSLDLEPGQTGGYSFSFGADQLGSAVEVLLREDEQVERRLIEAW